MVFLYKHIIKNNFIQYFFVKTISLIQKMLYNNSNIKVKGRLIMEELKKRIINDGRIYPGGIVKVDSFLNHQMDINLIDHIGLEFYNHFKDQNITKIMTIEASGIGIACLTARHFNTPVVFAKKNESKNMSDDVYTTEVFSYTKGKTYTVRIDKNYIQADDRILIIDDFLANGQAMLGLIDIAEQANATVCGVGICIEKGFQNGGNLIRSRGIDLYSLAILGVDKTGNLIFMDK